MAVWTQSDDDPLFRVQGHPIRVTEFLIGLYAAMFVALALARALHAEGGMVDALPLSTVEVLTRGKLWQLFTYPLLNPLSLGFAVEMLMLFWFGREVERAIGRRAYVILYLGLVAFPALLLVGISLFTHQPFLYSGSYNVHFALFITFALLFPNVPIFFGVLAKWVALICLSLVTLIDIADHRWIDLAALWTGIGTAVFAIKVPFFSEMAEWIATHRERKRFLGEQKKMTERKLLEDRRNESIDPILDKIATQGLNSLSREEKKRLEQARIELLKRDQRR